MSHLLFGIAGSAATWKERSKYARLWWSTGLTRGHVWLDAEPHSASLLSRTASIPPYKISDPVWKKFPFSSSQSAVRIARILLESFKLGMLDVRWFVMGDDDTVFFPENLATVLGKYDHSEMYYVGGNSESVEQDELHSYDMAFGGGGFAISYRLAEELVKILDSCLNRFFYFYGSDQRIWACVEELGVSLTREPGFHQARIEFLCSCSVFMFEICEALFWLNFCIYIVAVRCKRESIRSAGSASSSPVGFAAPLRRSGIYVSTAQVAN